jgi:hypothetical protein
LALPPFVVEEEAEEEEAWPPALRGEGIWETRWVAVKRDELVVTVGAVALRMPLLMGDVGSIDAVAPANADGLCTWSSAYAAERTVSEGCEGAWEDELEPLVERGSVANEDGCGGGGGGGDIIAVEEAPCGAGRGEVAAAPVGEYASRNMPSSNVDVTRRERSAGEPFGGG